MQRGGTVDQEGSVSGEAAPGAEVKPPPNVLLAGINGSTAYGLATEDSDIDRIGCYAAPTEAFHGLHLPVGKAATWVSTKPDATYHEAGKLAGLLLKANPTVTEICWLNYYDYDVTTPAGEALIAIRHSFLSAPAVRNAYLGYATQQFRRIRNRGDGSFSADTRKRTAKHARHLRRLILQGDELHRTGRLTVLLSADQAAACRSFGERVAAGDLGLAESALSHAEEAFDRPGVLPDRPDEAAAEKWLQDVRRAYWKDRP
jgi:predicted nucleotidyltransferase